MSRRFRADERRDPSREPRRGESFTLHHVHDGPSGSGKGWRPASSPVTGVRCRASEG